MTRRGGRSVVLVGVRGPGTVEQVEQVESESAVADEGGTVDSPGRRTGLGTVERVEQVRPAPAVVDGGWLAWQDCRTC